MDGQNTMSDQEIRVPVLKRLAEQAMSDPDFRAVARVDLDQALADYGYTLNPSEHALVLSFRATLEEAGVDLFLSPELSLDLDNLLDSDDPDSLETLLRSRGAGS
jgi:hypothetical protein